MARFSSDELERRRVAEAGFWKEMEERGLSRLDALLSDEHYERLNEIRRGLITQVDFDRRDRRVREFQANLPPRVPAWVEEEEAGYYQKVGRSE
tara:strand:- start:366 stop:647 length:282 start_codon:yes stop_codon:yes gene_type:complete